MTNMREEEEYDELPPITVNSSGRDSSWFAMPCAVELAAQRAREEHCERELVRLREQHAAPGCLAGVTHSDSSGSEGEAALAAAVTALRVRAAGRAAPPPRLAALLPAAAAARCLPAAATAFLLEYARATADRPVATADLIARMTLRRIESAVQCAAREGAALAADEAAGCGAWLCLALAGAERAALGPAAARAALALLQAAPALADALAPALLAALPAARARLELADALRGGDARADALGARLVRAALHDLLGVASEPSDEEWESGAVARWRRLDAGAQYTALQLAARARAGPAGGAGRAGALLAALAAAPPPARDHTPDALKVLVAASKMQVLFPAKN